MGFAKERERGARLMKRKKLPDEDAQPESQSEWARLIAARKLMTERFVVSNLSEHLF